MAENKKKDNNTATGWLSIYIALMVLAIIMIALVVVVLVGDIMVRNGEILPDKPMFSQAPVFIIIGISGIVGSAIALFVGKKILKPITDLSNALKKVSKGDFSVRLEESSYIDEIANMNNDFNTMAKELSGMETMRKDFIVNVSHEFKTPLASIEGYATLLQSETVSKEVKADYVEKIISNASRLSKLTGTILQLSKLENQEILVDKKEFSLDEQIRQALLDLVTVWENKNLNLEIELLAVNYFGNERLLYQVWYNLLSNAFKFTDENGTIKIDLLETEKFVTIKIADNGIGIDEENKKRIFDKFYQADKTHASEGNGLGLALVKKVVALHKGKIELNSEKGKGSEFIITLPKE